MIFKSGRKKRNPKKTQQKEREREREREEKKQAAKTGAWKNKSKKRKNSRTRKMHARTQTHKARAFVFKRPSHRNLPADAVLDLSCLQQLIILAISWSPSGVLNPTQFALDLLSARSVIQNYYNRLWGAGGGGGGGWAWGKQEENKEPPKKPRNFLQKKSNKDIS